MKIRLSIGLCPYNFQNLTNIRLSINQLEFSYSTNAIFQYMVFGLSIGLLSIQLTQNINKQLGQLIIQLTHKF